MGTVERRVYEKHCSRFKNKQGAPKSGSWNCRHFFFRRNLAAKRKRQIAFPIEEVAGLREVVLCAFLFRLVLF